MPHFNGTGPQGEGPMTGHGRGYCMVPLNEESSFPRKGAGQGGRPRGGGRGRCYGGGRNHGNTGSSQNK